MSWLSGYKSKPSTSSSTASESDVREAKRKKLEQDRLLRSKQREVTKKQLQAAQESREEANKAIKDLLAIAPDILDTPIIETSEDILESSDTDSAAMEAFEVENGIDSEKALDKLGNVKCPFEKDDIEYWFSELEGQLEVIGVKSQWVKRIALQQLLPVEIRAEVKSLLKLSKPNAGNDIYLKIKTELIELFGQKPEDAYLRAKNRVMTGKPSQLGKQLMEDICKEQKKLDGCCCDRIVWGMFREALPIVVRNHIAELSFNKDTWKEIFTKADQVWDSNRAPEPIPLTRQVAAVTPGPKPQPPTSPTEVAAVQKSNGSQKNKKNNKNGQNKNQNATTTTTTTAPKPKVNEDNLCRIHAKWKDNATFCAAPWACRMKNVWKAPQ